MIGEDFTPMGRKKATASSDTSPAPTAEAPITSHGTTTGLHTASASDVVVMSAQMARLVKARVKVELTFDETGILSKVDFKTSRTAGSQKPTYGTGGTW